MSETDDSAQRDPIDLLAEEFLRRLRRGPVDIEAFAAEHPAHAGSLRDLLPTLLALEGIKRERASSGSGRGRVAVPALSRLGDFRIVGELGRGGMGVVFDAVQESLGRRVALKVLPQASLLTGNQLERFRREAQIAAQLHHSNIVPVFGSGESEGYHWYAMQFIAGQSLERWRQSQAETPPNGSEAWRNRARLVAHIGVQAAAALHYAHSQGTLHRDIKPANLLLEASEHLWVTDFGLAKALEAEGLTHSGDLLGTLQYMAPEQFTGSYDVRSEVYALGITLYELLVLRAAFGGKTRSELMERIRTERPEPLRRLCPEAPEDLVVVVEKAMARDPADRYHDAHELEQDLQAYLEDRPIRARRQSSAALVLRWCRRNRAMAALAASTLFAVLGAGVYGWIAYGIADQALGEAKVSATKAEREWGRAETNLALALAAFEDVFDALVGRDPTLALDEDPDTGEQTVIVRTVVEPGSVELLNKMLSFYRQFAAMNAENQSLRFETARAYRRVGAIHARLGKPENLAAAQQAYEQALTLLEAVTGRDVSRELAAVHVDFGQLEQRRHEPFAAAQRYRRALALLENEQAGDKRTLQFERAQAHFLLARLADPAEGRGPRAGPGGPGGPGGGERRDSDRPREQRQSPKQELQAALSIVSKLLQEEPSNREFLALQARCLLLSSRMPSRLPPDAAQRARGPGERRRDPALEAQREQGLDILRALVAQNPQADQLRFELCGALIEDRRREGPWRGRREDQPGVQTPPAVVDLAPLREAKLLADKLVDDQPLPEYRALRGRVGLQLGRALRDRSDGEADPAPMRKEAEVELRAALDCEQKLIAEAEGVDPRFLWQVIETHVELGALYASTNRRAEARAEANAIFELLERLAALREKQPGPTTPEPTPAGGQAGGPAGDGRFGRIEDLLRGVEPGELGNRLRQLRERLARRGR